MPFKSLNEFHKCKYCDKPAKINYFGIKRRHKGYLTTCGDKECLNQQYLDKAVNQKKAYINKGIIAECEHCHNEFIKSSHKQKWCNDCIPDKKYLPLMQRYNLTREEYLKMVDDCGGICIICNKNNASVVDHDHETGEVRGVICNRCNLSLSLIEDKESLERALKYLKV